MQRSRQHRDLLGPIESHARLLHAIAASPQIADRLCLRAIAPATTAITIITAVIDGVIACIHYPMYALCGPDLTCSPDTERRRAHRKNQRFVEIGGLLV